MSDLIKQLRDLEEMLINGESTRRVPIDLLVRQAADALEAKDATIDALMLEFCPERMSKEQVELWSDSQEAVK